MPPTKTKQRLLLASSLALLVLVAVPGFSWAQSYVEPSGPPPQSTPSGRPAIEFLNGSSAEQRKNGSLIIGERNGRLPNCTTADSTGCSRLCLNGDPTQGANGPRCIRDWSEISSAVGGPFLRLLDNSHAAEVDNGFVSVVGVPLALHRISLIGEANNNPAPSGWVGIRAESTSTQHYAGQFNGRVLITRTSGLGRVCLHGDCVFDWATAIPPPTDAVALQTLEPFTQESGHVSLTGLVVANSIIGGKPSSSTPIAVSCGDGICSSENGENAPGVCLLDCP